jgi:hypothetical protein
MASRGREGLNEPAFGERAMRTTLCLTLAACSLVAAASPILAQNKPATTATTAAKPTAPPAAAGAVLPEIRTQLNRVATALRDMKSYEIKADVTNEDVLESGQKIQTAAVLSVSSRKPDRLYLEVASERRTRQVFYDGKTLTLYGPANHYYASVAAPPTTYQALHAVADRYGLETPLMDLFEWGVTGVHVEKVLTSMYAGPDRISGKVCEHYAFHQANADWQIWIPKEDPALPCKLVITNLQDPTQPQFTAVFDWTPNPQLADDKFVFSPPQGAQRIALSEPGAIPQKAAK